MLQHACKNVHTKIRDKDRDKDRKLMIVIVMGTRKERAVHKVRASGTRQIYF